MAFENDVVPHAAIVKIDWEVHEREPDGSYFGASKDKGRHVFVLSGDDRALATEYLNALLDLIRKAGTNVNELEINEERLGKSRIQGASGPRENTPKLFGMRGKLGGNPTS